MEQIVKRKVLLLSSGDTFGAYEYLYRMAKAMENDYEIALVVREKRKVEPWIYQIGVPSIKRKILLRILNYVKRKFGVKTEIFQSNPLYVFLPNENESIHFINVESILNVIPFVPDIIISGMTDGFINTSTLLSLRNATGANVYQVMIDISLLTGGCHVVWNCDGFRNDCNDCPAILNQKFKTFAQNNLALKKANIQKGNFELIVIPGWTLHKANLSILYKNRVKLLSNGVINTSIFTNTNRSIAKQVFGVSSVKKIIFAGSNNAKDIRKGRSYLVDALTIMWETLNSDLRDNVLVLLAGNHNTQDDITARIKFDKKFIDFITDDRLLSLAYQASEIYVSPSLEDGGPMMVAEALACGTPVVGFETGSLFDNSLVENGVHGYRVKMKETSELAYSLEKILKFNNNEFQTMSTNARNQAVKLSSYSAFLKSIKDVVN